MISVYICGTIPVTSEVDRSTHLIGKNLESDVQVRDWGNENGRILPIFITLAKDHFKKNNWGYHSIDNCQAASAHPQKASEHSFAYTRNPENVELGDRNPVSIQNLTQISKTFWS